MKKSFRNSSNKKTPRANLRLQKGDFLLESLIGMVLMAIIGLGVVFVTSRVTSSQKDIVAYFVKAMIHYSDNGI